MSKEHHPGRSAQDTGATSDIGLGRGSHEVPRAPAAPSSPPPAAAATSSPPAAAASALPATAPPPPPPLPTAAADESAVDFPKFAPTIGTLHRQLASGGAAPAAALVEPPITLNVNTTTGGNFKVLVLASDCVDNLKKTIAKRLKVAKDRICLLHRERELHDGTLKENGLMDGSRIILIPNVETGLLAQRPENTVMQALESLNDSQVNDFLSGKTPLNLSMRLGDHMMLIQLQLSTVNPVNSSGHSSGNGNTTSSSSRTRSSPRGSSRSSSAAAGNAPQSGHNHYSHYYHHHHHEQHNTAPSSPSTPTTKSHISAATLTQRKPDIAAALSAFSSHSGQRARGSFATPNLRMPAHVASSFRSSDLSSFLSKRDYKSLQNIVRSIAMGQPTKTALSPAAAFGNMQPKQMAVKASPAATTCCSNKSSGGSAVASASAPAAAFQDSEQALLEQSPIKSLSNLVSSPIKTTTITNIPIESNGGSSSSAAPEAPAARVAASAANCQDPISAKLTSCLCTRLSGAGSSTSSGSLRSCVESACISRQDSSEASITEPRAVMLTSTPSKTSSSAAISATSSSSSSLLHKTVNNPIVRPKHRHHHHHHYHHYHYSNNNVSAAGSSQRKAAPVSARSFSSTLSTSSFANDSGFISEHDASAIAATSLQRSASPSVPPPVATADLDDSSVTLGDTRTLAEASRNLTQTLRNLSKEVFTNKMDIANDETPRRSGSGAVIESMKNHGKGIYSGTFSGTLNPALQDKYGRPKRDISTVIHILNDLLSATPQYGRGARISFEAPSTSSAITTGHTSRSKQNAAKHHHHHSYALSADSCPKCNRSQNQSATNSCASYSKSCAYGECNGHYAGGPANKQARDSAPYACCQDLSTNSTNDRNTCSCRYRIHSTTGEREREHMCQKCLVEMENSKTKSKLDQLRLVMQQRKQKREARKMKGAPYGARVVGTTAEVAPTQDAGATVTAAACTGAPGSISTPLASEVSPNHIVEEVDTAA